MLVSLLARERAPLAATRDMYANGSASSIQGGILTVEYLRFKNIPIINLTMKMKSSLLWTAANFQVVNAANTIYAYRILVGVFRGLRAQLPKMNASAIIKT